MRSRKLDEYKKILHDHLPELREEYNVQYLGVLGSYVRGEERPGSDLDILVEFSETPGLLELVHLENHLSELLGIKVDLVPKRVLKPMIGRHILEEVEDISTSK